MRIHHTQMNQLVKQYARIEDETDATVRKVLRSWGTEVEAGIEITITGMPTATFTTIGEFDIWCKFRFPRLFLKAD